MSCEMTAACQTGTACPGRRALILVTLRGAINPLFRISSRETLIRCRAPALGDPFLLRRGGNRPPSVQRSRAHLPQSLSIRAVVGLDVENTRFYHATGDSGQGVQGGKGRWTRASSLLVSHHVGRRRTRRHERTTVGGASR